jgi:plasmid stabilization system protein ParE
MNSKPIVPRQLANQDVDEAVAYYVDEGATDAALGFIDELERLIPTSAASLQPARHVMPTSLICPDLDFGP